MMFGADGRMVLQAVIAASGDDAKAQALALLDGHSIDLWDQLRFIDRFEPDPARVRYGTVRSSNHPGIRLRPNEDL